VRVVDASVVVNLLAGSLSPEALGDEELAVPHLIDSEVTSVLRRLVLHGVLSAEQGDAAFQGFLDLALTRFAADGLRPRMWQLRHNVSAYDATYVALAEAVGATALLTTDEKLAAAPGVTCPVVLL